MSNFSKIHFSVANHASVTGEHNLVPRLHAGSPENLAERYDDLPWQTLLTKGTLYASLDEIRRTLLHLMANGSPVTIPFLGTFTLTLGGDVQVENGHYQGHDVHVDGIRFTPDADFLRELRALSVHQNPLPLAPYVDDERLNAVLDGLFGEAAASDTASSAESRTITHADLYRAFDGTLSHHRISDILNRLVAEHRLTREGSRNQTRYRRCTS